jgi:hypothetical protein
LEYKKECRIEKKCPWGTKPITGMFARVENFDLFATDCLLYTKCPREKWTVKMWKKNKK